MKEWRVVATRVVVLILAAFLFGAAALTAWSAATNGYADAIPARAGAWFFLGIGVLTIELALSRLGERR